MLGARFAPVALRRGNAPSDAIPLALARRTRPVRDGGNGRDGGLPAFELFKPVADFLPDGECQE
jgi:hypothetical protein